MISEGTSVRYCGDSIGKEADLDLDDRGKVVSATPTHSHVVWRTGALAGQITLTANLDLVVMRQPTDDSMDGPLVSISAKAVYERGGATALLNAMVDGGHTTDFSVIAQEALALVQARIRQDPSFRSVLATIDAESGADLISLASVSLLRDAFVEVA